MAMRSGPGPRIGDRGGGAAGLARALTALILLIVSSAHGVAIGATRPAVRARHAMVAAAEPRAVEAALQVLHEGGNAVDAAVTLSFVLAVTWPEAGNLGGGGYMLIRTPQGDAVVIDYREVAPAAATRDMFLDPNGAPRERESLDTYRAVGVPGVVAGLSLALDRYGSIPLGRAIAPAVRHAREGIRVDRALAESLASAEERLSRWEATRAIFLPTGRTLREGEILKQQDLARTLETLARDGADAFYRGPIARAIARDMETHDGLITPGDLASYRPVVREPIVGRYRGRTILSAPPSSSGGVALIQMLNMLEPFDLESLGHNSSAYLHVVSEAMKRAYADRSRWLGDPEFTDVPIAGLLSPAYAAARMKSFAPSRATPAADAGPGVPVAPGGESTTHFSILDASGMAVSTTTTLNASYGCGAVAAGLGFLLNNEMDDFSIKPDTPNLYGLVGGEANSIAPRKRMLSSMTPTIVLAPEKGEGPAAPWLILGTPGGATIITTVLQTILNVVDFSMELQAAVDAPRFHHQWSPDRITIDRGGFARDVVDALVARGHTVRERAPRGDVQAILVDRETGWIYGAPDARGSGTARGD